MDFLNNKVVTIFGFDLYPLFFVILILIIAAVLVILSKTMTNKDGIPEDFEQVSYESSGESERERKKREKQERKEQKQREKEEKQRLKEEAKQRAEYEKKIKAEEERKAREEKERQEEEKRKREKAKEEIIEKDSEPKEQTEKENVVGGLFKNKIFGKKDEESYEPTTGSHNPYNIISSWQEDNITSILDASIDDFKNDELVESDNHEYVLRLEGIKSVIINNNYWSVADLVEVSPKSVLFLTVTIANEMQELIVHEPIGVEQEIALGKIVSLSNAIDRINGGFETGVTDDKDWFYPNELIKESAYIGSNDDKRMISTIVNAFNVMIGEMNEDGVLDYTAKFNADEEYTSFTFSRISSAYEELLTITDNIFDNLSTESQIVIVNALIYALRYRAELLSAADSVKIIRHEDFNLIRALASIADRDSYEEIIEGFED